jgi:hypothetical protein
MTIAAMIAPSDSARWNKDLTLLILIVSFPLVVLADDFKTNDGKEYKNVTLKRVEPDGIVLTSKSGILKLYFAELPPEIQKKYGYDPGEAADYQKQAYEAGVARAQEITQASQQQAEERARYWQQHPTSQPVQGSPTSALSGGSALARQTAADLNLHKVHRDMNGQIIFGIAPDGVTVGPSVGQSDIPMGPNIERSFAQELQLGEAGEVPSRNAAAIMAEQEAIAAEQTRAATQQQFDEQRRRDGQELDQLAAQRHQIENFERMWIYDRNSLLDRDADLANIRAAVRDSSLQSRIDSMRSEIERARAQEALERQRQENEQRHREFERDAQEFDKKHQDFINGLSSP